MEKNPSRRKAFVERRTALPLRQDGSIRVVCVADTHGAPHPASAERIAAQRPDAILHAGDIGDLRVLGELEKLAPVIAVRGNVDVRAAELPDALSVDLVDGAVTALRILLVHVALYGPRLQGDVVRRAEAASAQLVVCGHSHVPFIGRDRGLAVLNPGSIGPRRFRLPIVFGVLALEGSALRMWHVDCETGERWTP